MFLFWLAPTPVLVLGGIWPTIRYVQLHYHMPLNFTYYLFIPLTPKYRSVVVSVNINTSVIISDRMDLDAYIKAWRLAVFTEIESRKIDWWWSWKQIYGLTISDGTVHLKVKRYIGYQYTHQLNEYIFSEEHITVNNLNIHLRVYFKSILLSAVYELS